MTGGAYLLKDEFYLTQNNAGDDLYMITQRMGKVPFEKRGLQIVLEASVVELRRTSCLPTTLALAVNFLKDQRIFGLGNEGSTVGHILETAVLMHSNDVVDIDGGWVLQKGFPSIDKRTGNFYHAFLLGLAGRFNLEGVLVANLLDSARLLSLVRVGAVAIVSLDNLFIPQVSGRGRGISKLRVGRHVILLHGVTENQEGGEFICSDVFNSTVPDSFTPINLWVAPNILNGYLWSKRQPQITPRMVVLWKEGEALNDQLELLRDVVSETRINPLFMDFKGLSFEEFLQELRLLAKKS